MQLIDAFKQHPVQGTLIIFSIVVFLAYLVYIDRRKATGKWK